MGKQNCHTEPMKRCELEVRSRPKKAKKYVYHKDCKPVSRKVCDTCEKKTLSPVCDKYTSRCASTSLKRSVRLRRKSTASRLRRLSSIRCVWERRKKCMMIPSLMFKSLYVLRY